MEKVGYFLSEVSGCWNNNESLASAIFLVLWSNQDSYSLSTRLVCLSACVLQMVGWGDVVFSAHRDTEETETSVFWWRYGACSKENPCPVPETRGWTNWLMELLLLLPVGPMSLVSPLPYINHRYSGKCGSRLFIWITVIWVHFHFAASEHLKCKTTQNIWQYMESTVLQICEASYSRKDAKEEKIWIRSKSWGAGFYRRMTWGWYMEMVFKHLGGSCRDGRNEPLLVSPGKRWSKATIERRSGRL